MRHDDAGDGGSAKNGADTIRDGQPVLVVLSGLPTFTICSTLTVANWPICGTPFTTSSPRTPPPVVRQIRWERTPAGDRAAGGKDPHDDKVFALVVWPTLGPPWRPRTPQTTRALDAARPREGPHTTSEREGGRAVLKRSQCVRLTPTFSCRAINRRARGARSITCRPGCCNATLGRRRIEA